MFWLECALRMIGLVREEDFLGEAENDALGVAERALVFIRENHSLRQEVAEQNARDIAEGADHV